MIDIAAFLGLSLPFRCAFASALIEVDGFKSGKMDLDLGASDCGRLTLAASLDICVSSFGICGGLVSLSSGLGPAMDVSGTPLFRGGGGNESERLWGR